jgi:O-antigen/teichoic acid export membrane protein
MFGIPQATAYYARAHDRRQLIMSAWVFSAIAGLPIVVVIWPLVPSLLSQHPPVVVGYFRAFLLASLLVTPFVCTIDYLRGIGRTGAFNAFRLLQYVFNVTLLVALFISDQLDLRLALLAALVANLTAWLLTIGMNRMWPGPGFDRRVFGQQVHFGARVWVGTLSTMVIARFDQFLMVGLVRPAELGLYVVAATAAQITGPIGQGVALTLLPYLRADEDDTGRHQTMTRTALGWTLVASGATALVVAVLAPVALPLVYGGDFSAAVVPMLILLPGQLCVDLANVISSKLEADNRPGAVSTGVGLGATLTLLMVVPAIELFGIRGAAVVTTLSQGLFLAYVAYAERHPPTDDRTSRRTAIRRPLSGAAASVGVALLGVLAVAFGVFAARLEPNESVRLVVIGALVGGGLAALAVTRFAAFVIALTIVRSALDGLKISDFGSSAVSEPGVVVGAVLLVASVLWLLAQRTAGTLLPLSRSAKWILAFAAAALISGVGSVDPVVSIQAAVRVLAGALTFVVLEQLMARDSRLIRGLLVGGALSLVIPSLVGLAQLRDSENIYVFTNVSRIQGTFVHPNSFAAYLVIIAVTSFAVMLAVQKWARAGALLVGATASTLVLLTFARGAWIALAFGVGYLVLKYKRRLAPVLVLAGLTVILTVPSVGSRLADLGGAPSVEIGDGTANSLEWRLLYWREVLPLWTENPISGLGLDQVPSRTPAAAEPHNGFVQALVETGILGFTAFIGLTVALWRDLREAHRRAAEEFDRWMTVGAIAVGGGIFLQLLTENLLTQVAIHIYLWIPFAYATSRLVAAKASGAQDEKVDLAASSEDPAGRRRDPTSLTPL